MLNDRQQALHGLAVFYGPRPNASHRPCTQTRRSRPDLTQPTAPNSPARVPFRVWQQDPSICSPGCPGEGAGVSKRVESNPPLSDEGTRRPSRSTGPRAGWSVIPLFSQRTQKQATPAELSLYLTPFQSPAWLAGAHSAPMSRLGGSRRPQPIPHRRPGAGLPAGFVRGAPGRFGR